MHKLQLFKHAVLFMDSPKKKPFSRAEDVNESLPCTAFLVPSVPNKALREPGASAFAFAVLVGPMKLLQA